MSDTKLASAIDLLEAVEVASGRYAYEGDGHWFIATAESLIRCQIDDEFGLDEHSTAMPSWWSPEQRFAWRCDDCGEICETQDDLARVCTTQSVSRITADLNTGQEIPA